MNTTGMMDLMT